MNALDPSPRRPRVLQCITRLGLGGAERVAMAIARELKPEIDFAIFTVHGANDDALGNDMRHTLAKMQIPWFAGTRVPMKLGGMLPGGMALARAVRAFRPDVIHFHSETPEACGAAMSQLAPNSRGTAMVRTIHNSIFWRYWPRIGRWCDRRLARARIACVSEAARAEFLRYRGDSRIPPPSPAPVVIYNGVSYAIRRGRTTSLHPNIRRVLFAGRFEPQKGTDVLCEALAHVHLPAGVRGELTCIGHGAQRALVERLMHAPPANWSVQMRGPVAELGEVFADFDLLVMPSRFEGLGLVAIEATLCGLPVVTTDAPGLREALPDDYPWRATPGVPTSLAESLSAALTDTARWNETVRAAQIFAHERFSPAAMAAGYRRIYAEAGGAR